LPTRSPETAATVGVSMGMAYPESVDNSNANGTR
jgi:hypothetical protein